MQKLKSLRQRAQQLRDEISTTENATKIAQSQVQAQTTTSSAGPLSPRTGARSKGNKAWGGRKASEATLVSFTVEEEAEIEVCMA